MTTLARDAGGEFRLLPPREVLPRLSRKSALNALPPCVYFVRHMDALKIGWSANLGHRLCVLRGARLVDLLAFEPGDRSLELATHRRFAHLRIDDPGYGREHFRLEADLLDHVNQLRQRLAQDPISG